jgi:hypothetical protein
MPKAFYDWISAILDGQPIRKNGEVISADFNYQIKRKMEFLDAIITEVKIPALDKRSKRSAPVSTRIDPAMIRKRKEGNENSEQKITKSKKGLVSNFRFELGDLPAGNVIK